MSYYTLLSYSLILYREEKRLVVLQKAVRLRERSVVSAQNIIKDKELKAAAMLRYKEHITKINLIAEKNEEIVRKQHNEMHAALQHEQQCWIDTPAKVEEIINESLFDSNACTTGLETRTSENWRHYAVPFNLNVLFNTEFQNRYGPSDSSPEARYVEAMSNKRLEVRDMMNTMISSGSDRQNYSEIVDKFVDLYSDNDVLLEPGDFLDDEEVWLYD